MPAEKCLPVDESTMARAWPSALMPVDDLGELGPELRDHRVELVGPVELHVGDVVALGHVEAGVAHAAETRRDWRRPRPGPG